MVWYSTSIDKTLEQFSTSTKGLSDNDVENNRSKFGSNKFKEIKSKSSILLFLEQFHDPVIYILIVAAVINSIVADLGDAIVIGFVVLLNTIIGFIQEQRAAEALKSLRDMTAPTATVLRNGKKLVINAEELVCGDILLLESGVRAPADARLIESHNLLVDESMLTGESMPSNKKHDILLDEETALGDRKNMVYSGTIIQKGRGMAVVTAVGQETEFGKISKSVEEADQTVSPLQESMAKVSKQLSLVIGIVVVVIFVIGWLQGFSWVLMMMTSVGLAVSAIPEGLPVAVTITLSIGIYQMAKHNAVVKKLSAVETLGSTNVICTDKTGTLTKNQMAVDKLYVAGKRYTVSGLGYSKSGDVIEDNENKIVSADDNKSLQMLGFISAFCTESEIIDDGEDWKISGDPTEAALMIAADKLKFNSPGWNIHIDIPFESENQYMAVRANKEGKSFALVKGAPEVILNKCSHVAEMDGKSSDLKNADELRDIVSNYSSEGLRVLALAYKLLNDESHLNESDLDQLIFVGFAGIQDSVRSEAIDAVEQCHKAGIKVVMITGDHVKTASSVANQVKIVKDKERVRAYTGLDLDKMDDDVLKNKVPDADVYARVAPEHKLRIVKQLQQHENIVAMTGDGVNDAPALKQADIGVAMGTGSDVAKEASQMVLLDDNFATIVKAVRRGRVVMHNLQHILVYILATSFGGLLTMLMSVLLGMPLPLLPVQLLWVNLVTDGTSTFPLGFEKEHGDVMEFDPRKKSEPLINKLMLTRMLVTGSLMMIGTLGIFYFSHDDIFNLTKENFSYNELKQLLVYPQTMAFTMLAFFQIWNVQNSRSLDRSLFFNLPLHYRKEKLDKVDLSQNPLLFGVMTLAILLQVAAVQIPFMNDIMHTTPLSWQDWGIVVGVSFSIIIVVEIAKISRAFYKYWLKK